MAYRTILVSLGIDAPSKARRDVAIALAAAHGARLVGCFTSVWSDVFFRDQLIGTREHAIRVLEEQADKIRAEFETACAASNIDGVFRRDDGDMVKTDIVATAALSADLCVLSCGEKAGLDEGDIFQTLPESLIFAASCPVLLLPEGVRAVAARNILVAWKPRREAARAMRDAVPMLRKAERVTILTIGADEGRSREARSFLQAHGVAAVLQEDPSLDLSAGEVILAEADRLGCDLLVMGAYGHTRFRELVLGGATRHVLLNSEIPILMSH